MPLDPIVSLSVALAEAPGTCAFFLGSGVSRDAGVPTGGEIMQDGLRRLYRLESKTAGDIDDDALHSWLEETGRREITYSQLLADIAPDPAVRREYLASFFDGKVPGPSHLALASLAERGFVRVFITTNFDRLLEHALQARGIDPVVIASDADLEAAMPREHAPCLILKPHGDYLRQTIRNTPQELASLEPGLTEQLQEVFSRYALVVLGYSGGDEAVVETMRARRSRYGVWWVARGQLGQPANELLEAIGGRLISRDSAAEFLADLDQRLATFEEHPTGLTPPVAHDAALTLVRSADAVGLEESLRRERNWYEEELDRLTTKVRAGQRSDDTLRQTWAALRPILERRLATLLPLVVHTPDRMAAEFSNLARGLERRPSIDGPIFWREVAEYAATWLGYVAGALAVRLERWEAIESLVATVWTDANGRPEPLVSLPGEVSHALGDALVDPPASGGRWLSSGWEHLTKSLAPMGWLRDRYPELYTSGEPRRSMGHFDLLLTVARGLRGGRSVAFFSLAGGAATELALRLHRDDQLRRRVAEALGATLERFDGEAPAVIRDAHSFPGGFTDNGEVASALETGSRF